ncbi:aminopeptidase [Thermodesulfobacteriota bacterium]
MKDIRLEKLANLIINYSVKVQPEDYVFIICDEVASPFMIEAAKAAVIAGGLVETLLNNQEVAETKLKYGSHKQITQKNFLMEAIIKKADVLITAWGGRNTKINANINIQGQS